MGDVDNPLEKVNTHTHTTISVQLTVALIFCAQFQSFLMPNAAEDPPVHFCVTALGCRRRVVAFARAEIVTSVMLGFKQMGTGIWTAGIHSLSQTL